MIRTFLCVEIPESARVALDEVVARLRSHGARISWQQPSKFHVTLVFLGDVTDDTVLQVVSAAGAVAAAAPRFALSVEGLGAFPTFARPRTLWAGLAGELPVLATLASQLEAALVPTGYVSSGKPYRPHLTLGRVKDDRDPAIAAVARAASQTSVRIAPFDVREIVVMRSDLGPGGARYSPLARLDLDGIVPESDDRT